LKLRQYYWWSRFGWLGLAAVFASAQVTAQSAAQSVAQQAQPADPPTAALSEGVRDILARMRPAVVQIKGYFGSNTAHAFHGTGFAVTANGELVTNYHVVAQQVLYPDKYRLEYHTPDGANGKLTVLAIDVRHDLAVVRAENFKPTPLSIDPTVPAKGTRAYSIGFPLDVGLTITEGISNGRVADAFDSRIHYSGAINGGMSGGPALNAAGQVIGVNVAGYRFEQLVSFLVPAAHLQPLITRALAQPSSAAEMKADVTVQLRAHADQLLKSFPETMSTQLTAGYRLPTKLAGFVDCNAAGDPAAESVVEMTNIQCGAKAGLFVQQGFYTGDIRYSHHVLTTKKLDAWRFARRLAGLSQASGTYGVRKHVGPFACETSIAKLRGFDASVLVCSRGYRKVEGLYDITIRVSSLNQSQRGFASHLDMHGVDFTAGMQFVKRFISSMEWVE
jgi:serine protease Do